MTVLQVKPYTFIGLDEVSNNNKFREGTLVVDSDEAVLCYVKNMAFLTAVNEKEITRLLRDDTDCIKYPKDEAILVQKRGDHELK